MTDWVASLLILHYADDALTNQCLDSLLPQVVDYGSARLVVVDNGSPRPYAPRYPSELVEIFRLGENLHMIPALARAMQAYPNEVYGLLNNDLICYPGMLRTVLGVFDDPDVGLVAPGSSDMGAGVLFVDGPGQWGNLVVPQVDNHCIFVNHALVEDVGYPETDGHTHRANWAFNKLYCWKAQQAGYKVIAALDAYVDHLHKGGYDSEADNAGKAWLRLRVGDKFSEVW